MSLKYEEFSIVGLILGFSSLVSWLIPIVGYVCSIVGLTFSGVALNGDAKIRAVTGLILNIIGLSLAVAFTVIYIIFFR